MAPADSLALNSHGVRVSSGDMPDWLAHSAHTGPRRRLLQSADVSLGSFVVKDGPAIGTAVGVSSVTAYTCQEVCELKFKASNPGFLTYAGSISSTEATSTCYGDTYVSLVSVHVNN